MVSKGMRFDADFDVMLVELTGGSKMCFDIADLDADEEARIEKSMPECGFLPDFDFMEYMKQNPNTPMSDTAKETFEESEE